ncbi:MAG: ABC transporter substrate-binding protein [Treponema sp.]|nr:ABC transporter substrate-binding protein [Treponema sp.]
MKTKRIVSMVLVSVMALTLGLAQLWAGGRQAAGSGRPHHIVMAYIGGDQQDMAKVTAAINEASLRDINMTVEFIQMGFGDYNARTQLILSGGDEIDIVPIFFNNAGNLKNSGLIVNLADYIYDHGKDILAALGEDVAVSGAISGFVYGTPAQKESASRTGIVMRKDIVDACGIDVSAIHTLTDLGAVYAKVKARYPNIDCFSGINFILQIENHDTLLDDFGVLLDGGRITTVTNWFESEEFRYKARLINEYYKAGYVKLDAATSTETAQSLVRAGTLFSYLSPVKPGFLIQENAACGREMVTAYIGTEDRSNDSNNLYTYSVNFFNWGIAASSKDPVKAMQFLNWCYKSPDFNNLINFGIEGEHYAFVNGSNRIIDFPPGIDGTNNRYHLNMGWFFPNQFIGHIWNGLPGDIWDQYKRFNDSAHKSRAFGFMYDSSSVQTILAGLSSIQSEYVNAIATGSVEDVDKAIQELNQKLYSAGLQRVIDLKQSQLNAWLASRK